MLRQNFVHRKHMYLVLFEDGSHCIVAAYHSLVTGILQVTRANVFPYTFDSLGSRELQLPVRKCPALGTKGVISTYLDFII